MTADGHVVRSTGERFDTLPDAIDVRLLGDTPVGADPAAAISRRRRSRRPSMPSASRAGACSRCIRTTASACSAVEPRWSRRTSRRSSALGCGRHRGGGIVCWDSRGKPQKWTGPANIIERVAGDHVSCDLTSSGVACTGYNDVGQLGTGRGPDRTSPVLVDLPGKPVSIAAADRSACAVLDSGELACWGGNDVGQLGDGTRIDRPQPIVVPGVTSEKPYPPDDGLSRVAAVFYGMSWMDLPAACKQPHGDRRQAREGRERVRVHRQGRRVVVAR